MADTSTQRSQFWRSDWFVGVLVVLAVLGLHGLSDFFGTLERRYYDYASTSTLREPSDRIAIIAIDDRSIANIGRWPWPRDVHAQLIDLLSAARAKTIAHTAFFFEPQTDRGLVYIRQIKAALGPAAVVDVTTPALTGDSVSTPAPSAPSGGLSRQLGQVIAEAEVALDTDAKLAASMARAGNVLVPSFFILGEPRGRPDEPLPPYALKSAIEQAGHFSLPAVRSQQPIEAIGTAASGIGHLNQLPDVDGAVRREPLLVNYDGKAVPSMALLTAAHSLNLAAADIRPNGKDTVQIGTLAIRTDDAALMLPQFYKDRGGRPAFVVDSFYDVLSGKIPASKYAGKIVIIGGTAVGVGTLISTPAGPGLSPAETIAHMTSSILGAHFIVQPAWGMWATLGALALVVAYLVAGLPRLSAGKAAALTLGLFLLLLGAEFSLLSAAAIWLQLVFPAALLLIGHLALTTKRFLMTEAGKLRADEESAETNRMMGLALQGQGQPDMAFDRFRRVPFSEALMDNLNNLALDFERKRQFNKAQAVYEYMASHDHRHKDLQSRLARARKLSDTVILGGQGVPGGAALLLDGDVEKPMLGRYRIDKELGKGAMGIVYLGTDPKIGRVVAIKTLALSREFEGEELDDARRRFFREAETAGRLQHQNIVTIFDAGEEHDLAYIAMEFLRGTDLTGATREGQLLPVRAVLSIVARVAEALAYAHRQSVVHRDIKPANIMYDLGSDTVKVTDFGIARITDATRTRTGLVLGTPSFMSPEQIAGKKVDGRSDLFSLGVMLFQLLSGALPFRGDSMAELMYKIANEEAPDIRSVRPALDDAVARVVARSLCKSPDGRYPDGDGFAADLRQAIAALDAAACAPVVSLAATPFVTGFSVPATRQTADLQQVAGAKPYDAPQALVTGDARAFDQTPVAPGQTAVPDSTP